MYQNTLTLYYYMTSHFTKTVTNHVYFGHLTHLQTFLSLYIDIVKPLTILTENRVVWKERKQSIPLNIPLSFSLWIHILFSHRSPPSRRNILRNLSPPRLPTTTLSPSTRTTRKKCFSTDLSSSPRNKTFRSKQRKRPEHRENQRSHTEA